MGILHRSHYKILFRTQHYGFPQNQSKLTTDKWNQYHSCPKIQVNKKCYKKVTYTFKKFNDLFSFSPRNNEYVYNKSQFETLKCNKDYVAYKGTLKAVYLIAQAGPAMPKWTQHHDHRKDLYCSPNSYVLLNKYVNHYCPLKVITTAVCTKNH